MTIGEKIQLYRKQKGLSQDELGQQLLVSRQTISLWEMNKTMPTIDNLLRLKEVLSVTVDDILGEDTVSSPLVNTPCESYQFQYSPTELKAMNRRINRPAHLGFILSLLLFFYFLFNAIAVDEPNGFLFLIIGFFTAVNCIHWNSWRRAKKEYRQTEKTICSKVYHYDVYNQYFVLTVSDHRGTIKTMRVDFADVSKTLETKHLLSVIADGQIFVFKKTELQPNSALYDIFTAPSRSNSPSKLEGVWRILSIVLFIASIACIFAAMVCVSLATDASIVNGTENMWIFFLFLPISVSSLAYGIVMKRKGYRAVKNIVVGIIISCLLCTYGSFSFIFSGIFSDSSKPINEAEQLLSIDIPTHSEINTLDYSKGTQSYSRGYVFSKSTISFEEENVKEFEENLSKDDKWISDIPNQLIGITSTYCDLPANYYIIYNTQTKEFNTLPQTDGAYRFINIIYRCDTNIMEIVDYEIEYRLQ